jgi:rhomboid protease GluP
MTEEIAQVRLFVAAFLGQPALVDEICAGPLRHLAPSIQRYWLAIAHAAGGDAKLAQTMFTALQADSEARMRSAAAYRIAQPPARVEQLGEGPTRLLDDLRERLRDAATYGPRATHTQRAVLSYAIVAVLVAIHAYVVWQQRTDRFAVYDYTLFLSSAVLDDGEHWRLVSAVFIHAGWMHLGMNVLGLLWFGPFVERFLGRVRYAVVFLIGGIGGYAVLAAIVALGWRDATAALGASGAVMALIGASIGIFLRASSRSQAAANRLRDMLGFVGVQVVFDILAPRVSMTAHLAGLAIGCVLGFAMAPRR